MVFDDNEIYARLSEDCYYKDCKYCLCRMCAYFYNCRTCGYCMLFPVVLRYCINFTPYVFRREPYKSYYIELVKEHLKIVRLQAK